MNIFLEKLLEKTYELDDKDKYEIRKIFDIMNDDKKKNIIKNWDTMVQKILKAKQWLRQHQEIILGKTIDDIEIAVSRARKNAISGNTRDQLSKIKRKT